MKKIVFILLIAIACKQSNKQGEITNSKFVEPAEWETYEGRWQTKNGILLIELKLNTTTNNIDAAYQLHETLLSNEKASSTVSKGKYIFYKGMPNNEVGLCLQNLTENITGGHFRIRKESYSLPKEEMCFISRGADELLPTDQNFKPISTDRKYTLHKRKGYFTIEGYLSLDSTRFVFYERNTMQYWSVADLGEWDSVNMYYKKNSRNMYESVYLKALAYVVRDTASADNQSLVIKRIKAIGEE
jgi:hypothetical protein